MTKLDYELRKILKAIAPAMVEAGKDERTKARLLGIAQAVIELRREQLGQARQERAVA